MPPRRKKHTNLGKFPVVSPSKGAQQIRRYADAILKLPKAPPFGEGALICPPQESKQASRYHSDGPNDISLLHTRSPTELELTEWQLLHQRLGWDGVTGPVLDGPLNLIVDTNRDIKPCSTKTHSYVKTEPDKACGSPLGAPLGALESPLGSPLGALRSPLDPAPKSLHCPHPTNTQSLAAMVVPESPQSPPHNLVLEYPTVPETPTRSRTTSGNVRDKDHIYDSEEESSYCMYCI